MGLVVLGLANVWQLQMVQTGSGVPGSLRTLGSGAFLQIVPYSLVVFVPLPRDLLARGGLYAHLHAIQFADPSSEASPGAAPALEISMEPKA